MSTPISSSSSNRLMLDMQASDTNAVPYELFEASQAQLREAAVALTKHKSSLASALGEVNNLRGMVSALETNVETLKMQNDDLFEKLRESRRNEETLISQVTKLTDTTEFLSHQLQQHAKSAAQRYSSLLEMKEESEAALRLRLDRVTDQLISSQQPQTRVIPWSYTFKQHEHPAHVLKLVVQADANRENRMMRLQLSANRGGEDDDGVSDLEKLLTAANTTPTTPTTATNAADPLHQFMSPRGGTGATISPTSKNDQDPSATQKQQNDIFASIVKSSGFAEDAQMWRTVCRRIHQVLSERRLLLRTKNDGPLEFLLRTRHELAASVVQMREDVKKLSVVLNTMLEKMAGKNAANSFYSNNNSNSNNFGSSSSNNNNNNNTVTLKMFEGSIEILQTSVSDLSHTVQRVIAGCLTDADRILLGLGSNLSNAAPGTLQARYDKALSYRKRVGSSVNNDNGPDVASGEFNKNNNENNNNRRTATPTSTRTRANTTTSSGGGGGNFVRNSPSTNHNVSRRNDFL